MAWYSRTTMGDDDNPRVRYRQNMDPDEDPGWAVVDPRMERILSLGRGMDDDSPETIARRAEGLPSANLAGLGLMPFDYLRSGDALASGSGGLQGMYDEYRKMQQNWRGPQMGFAPSGMSLQDWVKSPYTGWNEQGQWDQNKYTQQPYSPADNGGFGGFLKAAIPFALGGGALLGGFPGIPGISELFGAGGGAGAGTGAGFEVLGGGAGGPLSASSGGSFLGGGGALPSVMDAGYGLGSLTAAPGAGGAALTSAMSSAPSFLGGAGALPSIMDAPGLFGSLASGGASAGGLLSNLPSAPPGSNALGNVGDPTIDANAPTVNAGTGGLGSAATGAGGSLLGSTAAGGISQLLKSLGINVDPSTLGLLGTLGSTALGYFGAKDQSNALSDIANRQSAITQPFVDDALDMMRNPEKFYQRPEVTGAIDASLRGLSAKVGNPINNPGALAQQAAYNTGLYNTALSQRLASAFGGQDTLNRLQTQAALAKSGPLNALGSGLGSLLNNTPDYQALLMQKLLQA